MLSLLGVATVVVGFAVGLNPLLVVVGAAFVAGLAAGLSPVEVLAAFGKAFNENRYISVAFLTLPMIGVVERAGIQEQARSLMQRLRGVSVGPLLVVYLLFRQGTAALGLISIAGHAQSIRPIIAPMAEGAIEAHVDLSIAPPGRTSAPPRRRPTTSGYSLARISSSLSVQCC